jgi:hypothetical protein
VPIVRRSAIHPTVIVVSARKPAAKGTFTEIQAWMNAFE